MVSKLELIDVIPGEYLTLQGKGDLVGGIVILELTYTGCYNVGSLAAGVAHEVRNPLGALSAYVDVLRCRGADPEVTEAMRGAIERIERTVESLLTYARPAEPVGLTDMNAAVRTRCSSCTMWHA